MTTNTLCRQRARINHHTRATTLGLCFLLLSAAFCLPSFAQTGTISVGWGPVSHPQLAGYRVVWGLAPGTYGTNRIDVGLVTSATVPSLTDCTTYYVAVRSRSATAESPPSSEISGWPRLRVSSISPVTVEVGQAVPITITGANFTPGTTLTASGGTLSGVTVADCRTLRATLTSSAAGTVTLTAVNSLGTAGTGTVTASQAPLPAPVIRRTDTQP